MINEKRISAQSLAMTVSFDPLTVVAISVSIPEFFSLMLKEKTPIKTKIKMNMKVYRSFKKDLAAI